MSHSGMLPLILLAIVAPVTAWFGWQYFRAANSHHETDKERQCESTQT